MKCILFYLSLIVMMFFSSANAATDLSLLKVRQSGILRVCTTGDYPPLTQLIHGVYRGQAITQAYSLAHYLHVKVKFIKTTWPALENDVANNKCEIAMGGISRTNSRLKNFLLTIPVASFGKTPLVRCDDIKKYSTLQKIDQTHVRVIENLGGTNDQYARRYLAKAQLITVKNNSQTFRYLLQKKADVMITDNIEAVYRQKIMPELCAVHPQHPFTREYKVYMLPKASKSLLKVVNQWIRQRITLSAQSH